MVVDGGWWMVVDGGWTGSENQKRHLLQNSQIFFAAVPVFNPVLQPSGVPGESQLVLTDGGGWWMDGQLKSKKILYFKNFSNTIRYFFLVVSRPLRRVFKTFSWISSKKNKIFMIFFKFRTIFFQRFLRFFEVCSSGNLVNFLEVCSSGVLEEISLLTIFLDSSQFLK